MSSNRHEDFRISEYAYIGSAAGNAFYSGIAFEVFFECMCLANCGQKLDENVSAAIYAREWLEGVVNGG